MLKLNKYFIDILLHTIPFIKVKISSNLMCCVCVNVVTLDHTLKAGYNTSWDRPWPYYHIYPFIKVKMSFKFNVLCERRLAQPQAKHHHGPLQTHKFLTYRPCPSTSRRACRQALRFCLALADRAQEHDEKQTVCLDWVKIQCKIEKKNNVTLVRNRVL